MSTARESLQLAAIMDAMGAAARTARTELQRCGAAERNEALLNAARVLGERTEDILAANRTDMSAAEERGLSGAMLDRLMLDDGRVRAMATGLEAIAALPDPVGKVQAEWQRPNGLRIQRVSVPLGVIGIIYESRPNVTADAGGLCLKAGNAAILRGGSESFRSSRRMILECPAGRSDRQAGLVTDAVQMVPTTDRAAVGYMLSSMADTIDVVVPRGGKRLIQRVQDEARVPVIGHLEGICHVYLHESADREMAEAIVVNAKLRRTGICGAAETLLVDRAAADRLLPGIVAALVANGCAVRGDAAVQALAPQAVPATEEDWSTEYLDAVISCRVVDDLAAAAAHIARYGSGHTETIVSDDADAAEEFLRTVDSAIVLHNASTQFADGGEFGMGAEIGIATGRIHARGPVGAEQLTSYKYVVRGSGQVRPA